MYEVFAFRTVGMKALVPWCPITGQVIVPRVSTNVTVFRFVVLVDCFGRLICCRLGKICVCPRLNFVDEPVTEYLTRTFAGDGLDDFGEVSNKLALISLVTPEGDLVDQFSEFGDFFSITIDVMNRYVADHNGFRLCFAHVVSPIETGDQTILTTFL
jgi:hypothetical protein